MHFYERSAARHAVNKAEADGKIADSLEVRKALMARVESGEITLEQAQGRTKAHQA